MLSKKYLSLVDFFLFTYGSSNAAGLNEDVSVSEAPFVGSTVTAEEIPEVRNSFLMRWSRTPSPVREKREKEKKLKDKDKDNEKDNKYVACSLFFQPTDRRGYNVPTKSSFPCSRETIFGELCSY